MPTPTPPVSIPSGQMVLWSTATTNTNIIGDPTSNNAVSTLTTGILTQWISAPLGATHASIEWSNFSLPVPAGATIKAIYPVAIYSFSNMAHTFASITASSPGGTPLNVGPPQADVSNVQINGGSLGTTSGAITSATMTATQSQSLTIPQWTPFDTFTIDYVGLAVYMTIPENWLNPSVVRINVGTQYNFPD